jgi:hypothetical protein
VRLSTLVGAAWSVLCLTLGPPHDKGPAATGEPFLAGCVVGNCANLEERAAPQTPRVEPRGIWPAAALVRPLSHALDGGATCARNDCALPAERLRAFVEEEDRNHDGKIDCWTKVENGVVVARELDENGDGRPDVWERFGNGRMTSRKVDRDGDGVKDTVYLYKGASLVEERHDLNNDGEIDLIAYYHNRRRVRSEEDTDFDGRMDTWTYYSVDGDGAEVVTRIERDTTGTGTPDTFETYAQQNGKTVLTKREEDTNGDGQIEVVSIFENGELIRRQAVDPAQAGF